MLARNKGFIVSSLAAALAFGCSSQKSSTDPDSYSQIKQQELDSERREFIRERQEQLNKLDTEVSRLEARLQNEAKFVDEAEKAEWSQDLFELRQEQGRAQAELDRATKATPEEWAEMRGNLGVMVDSFQAGVNKTGAEITGLFRSDDEEGADASDEVDLCDMRVEGTKIAITEDSEHLIVQLTVQDQDYVEDLRERAERLSKQTAKSLADTDSKSSASDEHAPMIAKVTVENIQDGVRMVFTPAQGQRDTLKQQLEHEVEQIRNEDC